MKQPRNLQFVRAVFVWNSQSVVRCIAALVDDEQQTCLSKQAREWIWICRCIVDEQQTCLSKQARESIWICRCIVDEQQTCLSKQTREWIWICSCIVGLLFLYLLLQMTLHRNLGKHSVGHLTFMCGLLCFMFFVIWSYVTCMFAVAVCSSRCVVLPYMYFLTLMSREYFVM